MDYVPDSALDNSPNINSVLKPPKPRVPLKDLMAATTEEDNTASRKRRVSFANVNKIKEFSAGAESMVVCQTPAYEEPFSVSSDSSYPSGVDGWTPAKGQSSVHGNPLILPEKENVSIQSLRRSTGFDLTNLVGNSVQSTRYSVGGMDLTGAANSHEMFHNHPRFSVGMDLTNVVGHPSQNTRYSVNVMDLTGMANSHQSFVDHKTRFSMGMDLTNVIGHSTQNTRYSINGMDLTEAVNPHQTFFDQQSTRFSVGMDMTNVGNSMKSVRYSSNEMDITEAANLYYQNQSSEDLSGNGSDDSDALELTEAVNGVQFSVVSPIYKNDIGITENVLYSVNNTRYSVNSMDMTRGAVSCLSSARRKSSRYSLVNMDLTEALDNSLGDLGLEPNQTITDPSTKTGTKRDSLCEMELTEAIVVEGVTRFPEDNMEQTRIVADELEYSADIECSLNLTKTPSNLINPLACEKENILPKHDVNLVETKTREDLIPVGSKLNNMDPQNPDSNENELSHLDNSMHSSHSSNKENKTCNQSSNKNLYNMQSSQKIEASLETLKDNSKTYSVDNESSATNKDSKSITEDEKVDSTQNNDDCISFILKEEESLVFEEGAKNVKEEEETNFINDQGSTEPLLLNKQIDIYPCSKPTFSLNVSNCNINAKNVDAVNTSLNYDRSKELKLSGNISSVDNFEHNSTGEEDPAVQLHTENSIIQDKSKNNDPINGQLNEDVMDVSITNDFDVAEQKINIFQVPQIDNPEPTVESPEVMTNLNSSVMNMSIECPSLIIDNEDAEYIHGQIKTNDVDDENIVHVPKIKDNDIVQQLSNTSNNFQEENHQPVDDNAGKENQSIDFNVSSNTSTNLSSRSVYSNKNITMTRGRSKSFIVESETSLEISSKKLSGLDNEETKILLSTSVALNCPVNVNDKGFNQSQNNLMHENSTTQLEERHRISGKRSFEVALEPENDTEESPIKQFCLSREELLTGCDTLSNITPPAFLMDTVDASNETVPCLDKQDTTGDIQDQSKSKTTCSSTCVDTISNKISENKVEFSLRMDDSLLHPNMSVNPLADVVIDLCESSFDATTTEVRELLDNSRYKTKISGDDDEGIAEENENFNYETKQLNTSSVNDIIPDYGQSDQLGLINEPKVMVNSSPMSDAIENEILEEVKQISSDLLPSTFWAGQLKLDSKRKKEKVRTLGSNSFSADFIPSLVEIQFSVDSSDNVKNVNYHNIGRDKTTDLGDYLLRQARNYILPGKGSELISQLQSANKSYLAHLARNLNIICKYHNGRVKENMLTLEVTNCRYHFWSSIDVNIKYPKYLNQTDVTISEQKIGELKLSHVRRIFNSIEKNEDQLLNFAKAITELQYNN